MLPVRGTLDQKMRLDDAELRFFADLQRLIYRERTSLPRKVERICAVDASYGRDTVVAVATEFAEGRIAEQSVYSGQVTFPYVSGLFYLREGPSVVEAVRRLKETPQLLCFDAHGAAHPRSAGLSTICGMVLGTPSVGMAKSLLVGKVAAGPGECKTVHYRGRAVGVMTDSDAGTRYWSPGYSVTMRGLRMLIREHGETCAMAMAESHRLARRTMGLSSGG